MSRATRWRTIPVAMLAPVFVRIVNGFRALFQRTQAEQELDTELRAFLDAAVADRMGSGLSREEATRAARRELGSLDAVKDRVRDVGWESTLESVWRDVRYAVRLLRKSPGFASVAVLTLSLGIGATTAIFSLLDTVMLRSLPVRNPEELVLVGRGALHYPAFQAFREHTDIFVDLCATSGVRTLDVELPPGIRDPARLSLVSGSYFSTLGVEAAIGRTFTTEEDQIPGAHPVAVVSHGYWQRTLAGDPGILDRIVRVGGTALTVIGVAPPGFFGEQVGDAPDIWVPLSMWGQVVPGRNLLESRGTGWLRIIGRVRPGQAASGEQPALTATFRAVLTGIFGPAAAEDERRSIARATITLEPAARGLSSLRDQFARPLQLLMGAVVLVLLIACANIAHLLLARATARRREIDVRLALGMSRARLLRQLLVESLVLAALGGTAGLAVAWLGTEALLRLLSGDGSRLPVEVALDARLLVFVAAASLSTAILFGLAPAWRSARAGIVTSLVARREAGGPRQRLGSLLVVAQVAVSLVLLTGAGLFLRTIANLRGVDLGFAPDRLIVLDVTPHGAGYERERMLAVSRRLLDGLAAEPGVSSVSLSENAVLMDRDFSTDLMRPEGFVAGPEGLPHIHFDWVGPSYFATIGTPLFSGRDVTMRDDAGAPPVVAINEQMARVFFPGADPVGGRLVWGVGSRPLEIIAVARDVKPRGPRDEPQLRMYLPYFQMPVIRENWIPTSTRILVRTAGNVAPLAPVLRRRVTTEEPQLSVTRVEIGSDLVTRTLVQERTIAILLVAFGVLAVGLASLGLYGLIAYHVVRRTNEIGIRMALGAQRRDVLWVTLRQGLLWTGAGVTAGVPLAVSASNVADSLLFGSSATDAGTLTGAAGVLFAMGLLSAYIPARRAARIDPVVALRAD